MRLKIVVLTFVLKWGLRALSPVAHALGKSLPGTLPVFVPPKVEMWEDKDIYGCTSWRR